MRDYSKVSYTYWTGETGRAIRKLGGGDAQLIGLYLMTCQNANMIGLYYMPLPTLYHEVGIASKGALKALQSLSEGGFAHYDEASETVWVPEMAAHQIGPTLKPTDNRHKAVVKLLSDLRKSPFFNDFLQRYKACYSLPDFQEPSPSEGPSKPLRSQKQEQEQEQKKEKPSPPSLPDIPPELDIPAFRTAWQAWLAYRTDKKKPVSAYGAKQSFKDFAEWGALNAIRAIDNAIRNDWQGVFHPDKRQGDVRKPPALAPVSEEEISKQVAERRAKSDAERRQIEQAGGGLVKFNKREQSQEHSDGDTRADGSGGEGGSGFNF